MDMYMLNVFVMWYLRVICWFLIVWDFWVVLNDLNFCVNVFFFFIEYYYFDVDIVVGIGFVRGVFIVCFGVVFVVRV